MIVFSTRQKNRKLSVSTWCRDEKTGVFVSITKDGVDHSILLSPASAAALVEDINSMLDELEDMADG